jgi:hypothetical protein
MKNKTKGIGGSLTRKLGPLPVWVWAIAGFGLVWYYRNKLSAGSVATGTGTGSVAPAPTTPQAQQVLQPGESVYDPNTGTMTTAPGGGGVTDTTVPPDNSGLIDAITAAIAAGEAVAGGRTGTTSSNGGAGTAPPSAAATSGTRKAPKLGRGGVRAPFGHNRPATAPKGYRTVGQGGGFWEFLPKRTPKPKNQHGKPVKTTHPPKPGTKRKPRSTATMKITTGGRTAGRTRKPAIPKGKVRGGVKATASAMRVQSTKRTTPAVSRPVVRQRPVANAQPRRPAAAPSVHRTASTPPRTARTVTKPPPPARRAPARKR